MVRAKSAKEIRKSEYYYILDNIPVDIPKDTVNFVADIVHDLWMRKGNSVTYDENVKQEVRSEVLQKCAFLGLDVPQYEQIIAFMKNTDEKRLYKKVPCLETNKNQKDNRATQSDLLKKRNIHASQTKVPSGNKSASKVSGKVK